MAPLKYGFFGKLCLRLRYFLHKFGAVGLHSGYEDHSERGGGAQVVKGTARRVIVVRSPDPKIFEEAIFILREDAQQGVSAAVLMEEARRIAGSYGKRRGFFRRIFSRLPAGLIAVFGAAATGAAWLAVRLLV